MKTSQQNSDPGKAETQPGKSVTGPLVKRGKEVSRQLIPKRLVYKCDTSVLGMACSSS